MVSAGTSFGKNTVLNIASRSVFSGVSEWRTPRKKNGSPSTSSCPSLNSTGTALRPARPAGRAGASLPTAGGLAASPRTGPISKSSTHTSVTPGPA